MKGEKGDKGEVGPQGQKGDTGESSQGAMTSSNSSNGQILVQVGNVQILSGETVVNSTNLPEDIVFAFPFSSIPLVLARATNDKAYQCATGTVGQTDSRTALGMTMLSNSDSSLNCAWIAIGFWS